MIETIYPFPLSEECDLNNFFTMNRKKIKTELCIHILLKLHIPFFNFLLVYGFVFGSMMLHTTKHSFKSQNNVDFFINFIRFCICRMEDETRGGVKK